MGNEIRVWNIFFMKKAFMVRILDNEIRSDSQESQT